MRQGSALKLIDLLSLKPGALIQMHSVKREVECDEVQRFLRVKDWKQEVSCAFLPKGDTQKRHNLSKLLDISINTQVIIRYDDGKVLEIIHLDERMWDELRSRTGQHVEIMVDGRIIAKGEVVNKEGHQGILILEMVTA
jgi:flagellar motor switch/type III secretory pathway protein FliN